LGRKRRILGENVFPEMSVFFAPTRYIVVKIVHSNFEVVLQTMKHMVIYHGLDVSLEVIALHPVV
jgi:hypothetical protein